MDGPSNSARLAGLFGTSRVEPSIAVSRSPRQKHPGMPGCATGPATRANNSMALVASQGFLPSGYVGTPTGFAAFAKEIFTAPEEWVRRCYNLTRYSAFPRGGHFAALERPEELVTDIREFCRPLRE